MSIANTARASIVLLHQTLARLLPSDDGLGVGVEVGEPIALELEQSHFLHVAQDLPPGGGLVGMPDGEVQEGLWKKQTDVKIKMLWG